MFPASFRWRVPVLIGVVALSLWYAFPLQKRINLGLDLQGGMHLVLKVDTSKLPPEMKNQDVTAVALEILRNRIDQFGVREPVIQRQGTDHILIQLPGVTDRERALKLIGKTALMEFQLVSENQRLKQQALDGNVPSGYRLVEGENHETYLLETDNTLTGGILADAHVDVGQIGLPVVGFRLTKEGSVAFGKLSGANINRQLAIVLDGIVMSAPVIRARITDQGIIEGQFTREEAQDLSITLRAGALPAPISVEEERSVGPSLGQDSIRAGIMASAIGGLIVVIFMVLYYHVAGVIAVTALALNVLLILAGLGYMGATLTLPGIAGIILTIGMAVDANVLIYERIREELAAKRPLSLAISAGYEKAFSAILDSNVTTIISALFLYWFGTGPIRGFATTLIIGLSASLFTALFVTRVIFDFLLSAGWLKTLTMQQWIHITKIDFLGKSKVCYALSGVLIAISIGAFFARGESRYGIDFSGGLLQEYKFSQPMQADAIRKTIADAGIADATIQQFGSDKQWLIRTPNEQDQEIQDALAKTEEALKTQHAAASPERVRMERVGPSVGASLRQRAWLAILWSIGGILFYVALRFKHFDFGLAGVVALIHDVVVATGVLCLLGKPIDLLTITALLTIAGYSINDTIVIYDRVRENLRLKRKLSLPEVINLSVNECMGRTIWTSSTAIMCVLSLYFFGGEVLHDFALCLLVGFISGVYSTVYIASAFVLTWRKLFTVKRA